MSQKNDFPLIFENLRKVLKPFEKNLFLKTDTLSRWSIQRKMEETTFLRLGTGQKELCFVLSYACLYVPRPTQRYNP